MAEKPVASQELINAEVSSGRLVTEPLFGSPNLKVAPGFIFDGLLTHLLSDCLTASTTRLRIYRDPEHQHDY